eukprot:Gregarina_sp_Poly_1__779@NODE_1187_length_4827_cov_61_777101_g816_i0_p1_GENE_NODE_1187_length_4827_cov_61_777101_g816_i0NODE_1187_length_4827_cov_61_777101_g816_i0_p1_ORF_typecomplete_len837_score121_93CPSase_L_D2/PF02786_17/4_5e58Biotin_carb_N/PF00289_22/4_1e23Biotin_carb_N/PF00289_22/1e03Biotin_carb_C/PF02785_19/1_8e23Biotin_carb_C/PF02785_19/7_3e03ATPgrasp_3/PF02655_14/1_4e14Biotin_lipoyl/PF00364_22/1_4e10ATPgrasp_Ter/PF15632_6/1_7e08ATPgrasp/PF02222_22/8_6e08ATPgrasp/PF02222_22/9_9e03Dala_Da
MLPETSCSTRFISPASEVPIPQTERYATKTKFRTFLGISGIVDEPHGCSFDSVEDFCKFKRGTRPISRLLVANNGNAAIKAIKSLRAWCLKTFSNERELEVVGMATKDDELSNAEYISRCDYLAKVPAGSNNFNYANVHLIKEIAEEWDCDAVWPGWGHASEDPALPLALAKTAQNITWVGPSPEAMEALGCKIGSTLIAQSVGVPVVPWSGHHILIEPGTDNIYRVSKEQKSAACLTNFEALRTLIESGALELPLMLKAAAGGGGKGIRIVRDLAEAESSFRQVTSEVKGSLIFAMRLIETCRHLEVQILADEYGDVISLGCRDCTIQRRHQKIIEEGPPTICSALVLERMEAAAIKLCRAVGYQNAGTVEFLYDLSKKEFYFLEVNARLQVEHVVTEMLTDVNLPAAQIQVAMGIRLSEISDVALFLDKRLRQQQLGPRHCMTARVTAEDAEKGFHPTCGEIHELSFESSPHVWAYFSVGTTSRIHQFADSQFGHIFATGPDREAARTVLLLSLRSLIVRGEICTNVEALQKILESPDFINNETYTAWLEQKVRFTSPFPAKQVVGTGVLSAVLFAAVYKASRHFADEDSQFVSRLNQGQVPQAIAVACHCEFVYRDSTKFCMECYLRSPSEIRVEMNGSWVDCEFNPILPTNENQDSSGTRPRGDTGWYFVNGGLDGKHRRVCFREDRRQDNLRVTVSGNTYNFTKEKDPTQIRAPFSGKLVRWIIPSGQPVAKGAPYAEIEIMKMYVQLSCDDAGVLTHVLSEGSVFSAGDLLATLELPEGQIVVRPVVFEGKFPSPVSGRRRRQLTSSSSSSSEDEADDSSRTSSMFESVK